VERQVTRERNFRDVLSLNWCVGYNQEEEVSAKPAGYAKA
jgi:hypothetical protein